jgi:probable HAF family extracellular repeat protein
MSFRKAVLSLAVLLFAPLALAQGTYTQIDVPGAIATFPWGINSAGDVVGNYDAASAYYYGFVLSAGNYTTITYEGIQNTDTFLKGINDEGQIVGNTLNVAFRYDASSQTFTTLPLYDGALTYPNAINNAGVIASTSFGHVGLKLVGSTYTAILPAKSSNSWAQGVTTGGEIAGYALSDSHQIFSFAYHAGQYRDLPLAGHRGFKVFGISAGGKSVVGAGNSEGFLYQDQTLQTLAFPGASKTIATGVNDAGEVVGWFLDSNDTYHGYTWTPPAAAGKK